MNYSMESIRTKSIPCKYCCARPSNGPFKAVVVVFWSSNALEGKSWNPNARKCGNKNAQRNWSLLTKAKACLEVHKETLKRLLSNGHTIDLVDSFKITKNWSNDAQKGGGPVQQVAMAQSYCLRRVILTPGHDKQSVIKTKYDCIRLGNFKLIDLHPKKMLH